MPHSAPEFDEELKSKSEIKREMLQLQDFASDLVKMSKHQRSKLPLSEELKDTLVVADKILNKHEALRRHIRYIAKVLHETDLDPIKQAMDVMANKHQQETAKFQHLENLRDDIASLDNALIEETLANNQTMDRQKLRQLARQAAKEKQAEKPGKYFKELFSYLKSHVQQ